MLVFVEIHHGTSQLEALAGLLLQGKTGLSARHIADDIGLERGLIGEPDRLLIQLVSRF